jgi:hypothetical protein
MTEDIGDPQIQNLQFDLDGRISGSLCITMNCDACGVSEVKLDAQLDLRIPPPHRAPNHALEISFEFMGSGSPLAGFPVRVCCSCGTLETEGLLMLRRGN